AGVTKSNQWACAEPPCRKQRTGRPALPHSRKLKRSPPTTTARRRALSHPKREMGDMRRIVSAKIFALCAFPLRLLSKVPMSDERTSSNRRRNVLDGAYTAGLLIVAIVAGYGVLAPSDLALATTLNRSQPAPTPGPVSEYLGKPVERTPEPPRVTWPKMVSGQMLDPSRAQLEGASHVTGAGWHRTDADGKITDDGQAPTRPLLANRP